MLEPMDVVLACRDLMTVSRLAAEGVSVHRRSSDDAVVEALLEHPGALCVVDLTAFPDLPRRLREHVTLAGARVVGFAPHVHVKLLEAQRAWCDETLPRGAIVSRFERVVRARVGNPKSAAGDGNSGETRPAGTGDIVDV